MDNPGPSGKPYQVGSVAVRNCLGPSSHPFHPGSNAVGQSRTLSGISGSIDNRRTQIYLKKNELFPFSPVHPMNTTDK